MKLPQKSPRQGKWLALQAMLLILNSAMAGLAWRDHEPMRMSVSFAAVVVSSMCIGNLMSTVLWIGLVDQMLRTGYGQLMMIERLLNDRNEPRS